jgi:TPR repeat protein
VKNALRPGKQLRKKALACKNNQPSGRDVAGGVRETFRKEPSMFNTRKSLIFFLVLGLLLSASTAFAAEAPALSESDRNTLQQAAEAYKAKDFAKVKTLVKPLADKKVPPACFLMGLVSVRPDAGGQDFKSAEKYWKVAADAGLPEAQFSLGFLYYSNALGNRDLKKARDLWSKAAKSGMPDAQFGMGLLMMNGEGGGTKDEAGAVKMFRASADKGFPPAMMALARAYAEGLGGLKKDPKQARALVQKAADAGLPEAKKQLENMKE